LYGIIEYCVPLIPPLYLPPTFQLIKQRPLVHTEKAVLVLCEGRKTWIAKSMIDKIRLRKRDFEVYVRKSIVG